MVLLVAAYVSGSGMTPLKLVLLFLYAILIGWIAASFWSAALGFWVLLRRADPCVKQRAAAVDTHTRLSPQARTAILMPIYNEDTARVFAGIRAIWRSLQETDNACLFDFFILSDSRDVVTWCREESEWRQLCNEWHADGRIFYRNRSNNVARKSGNIADFVRNWGAAYRYMIVLDADSIFAGTTMQRMVRMMEAQPDTALIQAPPVPVNKDTLFARILQFASTAYGPIFSAGASFWQLGDSNFWGHNAIIRIAPFAAHCGLPNLPGREPFGGEILSHDFVEAALLRRAGWRVWLAYELEESYEEVPPTLIDYAKRDRRWCQGNLQHTALIHAHHFHPMSRLHFAMGVMSYLAAPLWFLFMLIVCVDAYLQAAQTGPVYFVHMLTNTLVPTWPVSYAVQMEVVLVFTLAMLFLPKLMALILIGVSEGKRRAFGGIVRATVSTLLETLFSILLAPVLMLFQIRFVLSILLRHNIVWSAQQRADRLTSFADAVAAHGIQTLIGVGAGVVTWLYVPDYFWWFLPVLCGILAAIPLSMLSSSATLGKAARRLGLFLTPAETQPSAVLQYLQAEQSAAAMRHVGAVDVLRDPAILTLHCALLPEQLFSLRQQHHAQGILYKLMDEGIDAVEAHELRLLFSHPSILREFHRWMWNQIDQHAG